AVEQVFLLTRVEQNVHQGQTQAGYLQPLCVVGPENARPDTYFRLLSKSSVGDLQDNSKHILVGEVVVACKPGVVTEAHEIKKERIAANSSKERIGSSLCY